MRRLLLFTLLLAGLAAAAADSIPQPRRITSRIGANLRGGHLFSSYGLEGYAGEHDIKELNTAASFNVAYSFSFNPSTRLGRLYPGAYQGIGACVTTFSGHSVIGTPISIYLFQGAPIKTFNRRLSLAYEWNFGASMGWHRYSYLVGPEANVQVGSSVNAVLNLGLLLNYRLSPRVTLQAGIEGTHYSNGNTAHPNPGVNTIGARIGVVYTPQPEAADEPEATNADEDCRGFEYDLLAYGAPRKELIVNSSGDEKAVGGHFAVAGLDFGAMYSVNRYLRAGLSLDLRYDEGSNLDKYFIPGTDLTGIRFYRRPFADCLMAGLSARAELVTPVFSVNLGIGRNFVAVKANRHFYQRLNLRIHVYREVWMNVGYQFHSFHKPDNLILGLGYTFGK